MADTSVTQEIPASADRVWQLIGGFGSLPDWLPFIPQSELSEGGRVRTLRNPDGEVIKERLEAFNEKERFYSYSIAQAPFPVADYLSTIRVQKVPGRDAAVVEWSGSFAPVGVTDDEIVKLFHNIYAEGLTALKARFEK